MTVHVAMSSAAGGIMFSDSQASIASEDEEFSGFEKQFCGPDFLVGVAGLAVVAGEMFDRLSLLVSEAGVYLSASNVESVIRSYLEAEVQPDVARRMELLVVTPNPGRMMVSQYMPSVFRRFGQRSAFGAVGTGAKFLSRALVRDVEIGVELQLGSLVDLLVTVHGYAAAASRSLTVNDRFFVGYLVGNRTYCMGHREIFPAHAPHALRDAWAEASARFDEILRLVRTIEGEFQNARRAFSSITVGELDASARRQIKDSSASIRQNRARLRKALRDYFQWYDRLLERTATAA
ncbi:hypothetical protein WME76_09695 [Sorangium sp. So ce119]|uniref:hypothetical protein n=1 Tax=Sorangium sp. So ce119 TaxID=3133279 RepID=UPI003F6423F6